jgi:hypothetical protein
MYGGSSKWINTVPLKTILNVTESISITNAHANNLIIFNNAANSIVALPGDSENIPVGFTFDVVRWQSYKVEIWPSSSVTLVSEGNKRFINAPYQCVTCTKINNNNGWLLVGALSATLL